MKYKISAMTMALMLLSIAAMGCSKDNEGTAIAPSVDYVKIMEALRENGASAEPSETITESFLGVRGNVIALDGQDVLQVYEYEKKETVDQIVPQISPDGSSIGTTMFTWIDDPHFYRKDAVIALYLGNDQKVISVLESLMGGQFAGR